MYILMYLPTAFKNTNELLTCARVLLSNAIRNLTSQLFPELALQYSDNVTMQIDIIETKWNSSARHGWWCQLPGKPIKYPYPSGLHFTRHPPPMNITVIINTNMSVFRLGKPTEDQRNHRAKLCAMAWAMATTGSGIFSNKGCEQACKNYILKQLGLFPGIDIIWYNFLLSFEDPGPKHHSWQPSCAIHKYH